MGDGFDRRRFLRDVAGIGGVLTLGSTGLVGCRTSASQTLYADSEQVEPEYAAAAAGARTLRRSAVDPANAGNLRSYSKAIKRMKATPFPRKVEDETGELADVDWWEAHAIIHMNFCPHGNWFFLPWHRAYLHYFERVIRKFSEDPGFALPYWNWSVDGKLPPAFWSDEQLKHPVPSPNPRGYTPRSIGPDAVMPPETVGKDVVEGILEITDFVAFASGRSDAPRSGRGGTGQLEGLPHNTVHGFIGGDMGIFLSPRDPIFWLHHCNIDRLWAAWQARMTQKGRSTLPPAAPKRGPESKLTPQLWLAGKLGVFYDVKLDAPADLSAADVSMTVEQVQSIAAMGYGYDTTTQLGLADTVASAPLLTTMQMSDQRQVDVFHSLEVDDATKTVFFSIERTRELQEVLLKARDRMGRPGASLPNLRLVAERVIVPQNPRTASLKFYIQYGAEQGAERVQYVGAHRFFGTEHQHSTQVAGRATVNLIFDLLNAMRQLAASGYDLAAAQGRILMAVHVQSDHAFPGHDAFDRIRLRLEYEEFG